SEAAKTLDELLAEPMTPQHLLNPALINRAVVAVNLNASDAEQWLSRAEAVVEKSNPLQKARLLRLRGQLTQSHDDAAELLGQALEIYRETGFPPGIAAGLAELGAQELARDSTASARVLLQRALAIRLK